MTIEKAFEAEKKFKTRLPITGYRYFALPTHTDQYFVAFNLTDCEACGRPAGEGNMLNFHETQLRLESLGMIRLDRVPDELGWCDTYSEAVCMECYVEE